MWDEIKEYGSFLNIYLRSGNTISEMLNSKWGKAYNSNESNSSTMIVDISNDNLSGRYLQLKIEMSSNENSSPKVSNVSVGYSTAFSIYFFTTQYSIDSSTKALVVANMTTPLNTEIQFGWNNKNSNDWNEYTIVEPNKFFELHNEENIKIGAKFVSYDSTSIPVLHEFSLIHN